MNDRKTMAPTTIWTPCSGKRNVMLSAGLGLKWKPNGSLNTENEVWNWNHQNPWNLGAFLNFLIFSSGFSPTSICTRLRMARWFWHRWCLCTCWAAFGLPWGTLKAVGSSRSSSTQMPWVPRHRRRGIGSVVAFGQESSEFWGSWVTFYLHPWGDILRYTCIAIFLFVLLCKVLW